MILLETYYFDLLRLNDADGIEFHPAQTVGDIQLTEPYYKLYKNTRQGKVYLEDIIEPNGNDYFLEDINYADVETGKCN